MPLIGTIFDLAAMLVSVGNKELPAIPFMPPFVTMEVERIYNENNEYVYQLFLKSLNNVF